MEYLPRIHHIAALQQSPRVPVKNERRARIIYRTDHLHVDVQPHLMGLSRQTSFQFVREDCHQEDGHSSDLNQKRSGILLKKANHKENGTESQN